MRVTDKRMTPKQAAVLFALDEAKRPISASEVARRIGVRPSVAASRLYMMQLKHLVANTWDTEEPGAHWTLTGSGCVALVDWHKSQEN